MNWKSLVIILSIVVLLVAAFLTKPVQVGLRTATLFVDMGLNYKWHITVPRNISISEVTYPCGDRTVVANLYQPHDRSRHSGVILAHGAVKDGKDDQALVLAAQSMARAGYVALVPQLDNLRTFRLHADDIETLVASFQYLWQQQFVNERIGIVGICLSAPMVLLAATDGRISDDVTVISSWGGYYDINDWLQAVIAEHYFDQGQAVSWKPRPTLKAAVSSWLIAFLPDTSERAVVEQLLKGGSAGLQEDTPTMDCCLIGSWPALSGSAEEKLSPMGQTIYQLLTTSDPVQTKQLWGKLTPEIQKTLNNLSPHLKVNQLRAKIAIIHTATDDVIPWVESPKLADAIDDEQEVYFKIFHRFYHTDIKQLLSTRLSQFADTVSEATGFYLYICSILYQL